MRQSKFDHCKAYPVFRRDFESRNSVKRFGKPSVYPQSDGDLIGHSHHLKPLIHERMDNLNNWVYLCEVYHSSYLYVAIR